MTGLEQAVKNQSFVVCCPYCRQENLIEIGRASAAEELSCDCGARFDNTHVLQAARQAEILFTKMLHNAGFR